MIFFQGGPKFEVTPLVTHCKTEWWLWKSECRCPREQRSGCLQFIV